MDIEEFNVVEIVDGKASVSVSCQVSVSANVVADDPDSWIKDNETKSVYFMWRMAGTVARTVNLTAQVTVTYNKDDPEQVTIESVEFEENGVEVFVEEQELERVDDNDYDMEPPDCEPQGVEPPDYEPLDQEPEDVEPPDYEPLDHDEP